MPAPGNLTLAIDRTYVSTIAGRYQPGIFGLGWTTSQTSMSVDGSGNVRINSRGKASSLQVNSSYLNTAGEFGALTALRGYTFTATDGTQNVFLANGKLNYIQDTNGNASRLAMTVRIAVT